MKKAFVSLILVLCLLAGTSLAENVNLDSAMPVVNEKVSVSIAFAPSGSAKDFKAENNWFFQYLDKFSNLDIEWIIIDRSTAAERVPIMLSSGEMPDALWGWGCTSTDLVRYGQVEKVFRPVNDLLQYMPTLSAYLDEHPVTAEALKASDGNMYGFPAFPNQWNTSLYFFVNTAWLKNVGLEMPKTLAEFKDMLIAFRDQDANGNGDPGDEIPWTGAWDTEQSERCFILSAYGYVKNGSSKDNLFLDTHAEERTLVYLPLEERYKDYLQYMHELWEEGLIDHDLFTQSETQVQAITTDNKSGFSSMASSEMYAPNNYEDWVLSNLLVDQEGHKPALTGPSLFLSYAAAYFVINADCDDEKAAALANLADFCYTLDGWAFLTYGPEAGTDMDWNNNGYYYDPETNTITYNLPADMTSAWVHRVTNLSPFLAPGFNQAGYDAYRIKYAEVYPDSAIAKAGVTYGRDMDMAKERAEYYVDAIPDFFFTAEDQERVAELIVPLDDYAFSMEASFITGEASLEKDYDTFIETLKAYGAEEYLEICNKYFSGN